MIDLNGVVQAIGERSLKLYRTGSGIRIEGDCPSEVAEAIRHHQQTLLPFIASAEDVEQVAEQQAAAEMAKCEDCGQVLVETLTFDGFLNLECPACERCFGCRPSTDEVASRFAGTPEKAILVVENESPVSGEVIPRYQQTLLPFTAIAAGDSERIAEQQDRKLPTTEFEQYHKSHRTWQKKTIRSPSKIRIVRSSGNQK